MTHMTRLGHILIVLVGCWAVAGCRGLATSVRTIAPAVSQDSIYRDADQPADPAIGRPYLGVGGPGSADSTSQEPAASTQPAGLAVPTGQTWQSVDRPEQPLAWAWIDSQPADKPLAGKTFAVAQPVSSQPTIRFETDPGLGRFRGAAIQVYRLSAGRIDPDSGIRISELDGSAILAPGKEIVIGRPRPGVVFRKQSDGQPAGRFELAPGGEYEIQLLITGSRLAEAVGFRVKIAEQQ